MADIVKCTKVICDESANDEELESISPLTKDELLLIYDQVEPHQFIARSRIGNMLLALGVDRESIPYLKSDLPYFKKSDEDLLAHIKTNDDPATIRVVISILQRRLVKNEVIEEVLKELDAKEEELKLNYCNLECEAMDDESLRVACKKRKEASIELLKRGVSPSELAELLNEPIEKLFSEMSEKERWYIASSDTFVCTNELLERMKTANLLKLCEESMRHGVDCTDEKPVTLRGVVGVLRQRQVKSKILDQIVKELDEKEEENKLNYENREFEAKDDKLLMAICKKAGNRFAQERLDASIELLKRGYSARELLKVLPTIENIKQIFSSMTEKALWYIVSSETFFCQQELLECMKTKNLLRLCTETEGVIKKNFETRKVIAAILLRRKAKGAEKVVKEIEEQENQLDYKNEKYEKMKSLEALCKTTQDKFHQERRTVCVELLKRGSSINQIRKLLPPDDSKILESLPQKALWYIVTSETFLGEQEVLECVNTENLVLLCEKRRKDFAILKVVVAILERRTGKTPLIDEILKEIEEDENKLDYKNEEYEAMDDKALKVICKKDNKERINAVVELFRRGLTYNELKKLLPDDSKILASLPQKALWYIVSSDRFFCERELLDYVNTRNLLLVCGKPGTVEVAKKDPATRKATVKILQRRKVKDPIVDQVRKEIEEEEKKLDYENEKYEAMDDKSLKDLCNKDDTLYKERIAICAELLKRGSTAQQLQKILPRDISVDEIFSHLSQKALWYIVSSPNFRQQRKLLDCLEDRYLLMLCGKDGGVKKEPVTLKVIIDIANRRKLKDPIILQVEKEVKENDVYFNEEFAAMDDTTLKEKCQQSGGDFHNSRIAACTELVKRGYSIQEIKKIFPPNQEIFTRLPQKALWYMVSSPTFKCQRSLLECVSTPNLLRLCESSRKDLATMKVIVNILQDRDVKDPILDKVSKDMKEVECKYKNQQYEVMGETTLRQKVTNGTDIHVILSASIELLKRGLTAVGLKMILPLHISVDEIFSSLSQKALWYIVSSDTFSRQRKLLDCLQNRYLLMLCGKPGLHGVVKKDAETIKVIIDILLQRKLNDPFISQVKKELNEEENRLDYKNEEYAAMDDNALKIKCQKRGGQFHLERLNAFVELLKRGFTTQELKKLFPPKMEIISFLTQKALWYIVSSPSFTCQQELLECMKTVNLVKLFGHEEGLSVNKDLATRKVIVTILSRRKIKNKLLDQAIEKIEEDESKMEYKNLEYEAMDDESLKKACSKVGNRFSQERLDASIELLKRGLSIQEWGKLLPVNVLIKKTLPLIKDNALWYIVSSQSCLCQQELLECMKTPNLLNLCSNQLTEGIEANKKDPATVRIIADILKRRGVNDPVLDEALKKAEEEEVDLNYKNDAFETQDDKSLVAMCKQYGIVFHKVRLGAYIELLKRGLSTIELKRLLPPNISTKLIFSQITQKALWYIVSSEKFCQLELLELMSTKNLLLLCGKSDVVAKYGFATLRVIIEILQRRKVEDPILDKMLKELEEEENKLNYKNPEYEAMDDISLVEMCKKVGSTFRQERLNASIELLKRGTSAQELTKLLPITVTIKEILSSIPEKAFWYIVSSEAFFSQQLLLEYMKSENLIKLCGVKNDPVTLTSICTILRSRGVQDPLVEKISKELEEEANCLNYKNDEYEAMAEQHLKDRLRKTEDKFHPERLSATIELLKRGISTEQITEMLAPQVPIKPILLSLTQKALWYIASSEKFICQQELLEYMKTPHLLKLCGQPRAEGVIKKGPAMRQVIIGILQYRNVAEEVLKKLEEEIQVQDYKNPEYEAMSNELLESLCKNSNIRSRQDRLNASVELLKRGVKPEAIAELLPKHVTIGNIATEISENARVYVVSAASSICFPELIDCMSTPNLLKLCVMPEKGANPAKQICALKQLLLRNVPTSSIPKALYGLYKEMHLKRKVIDSLSIDQLKNFSQNHLAKRIQEQAIEELRKRGVELPKIPPLMGEIIEIAPPKPIVPTAVLNARKEIVNKIREQVINELQADPKVEEARDEKKPLLPTLLTQTAKQPPLLINSRVVPPTLYGESKKPLLINPGMGRPTLFDANRFKKPSEDSPGQASKNETAVSQGSANLGVVSSEIKKRPHELDVAEYEFKKPKTEPPKQVSQPLVSHALNPVTGFGPVQPPKMPYAQPMLTVPPVIHYPPQMQNQIYQFTSPLQVPPGSMQSGNPITGYLCSAVPVNVNPIPCQQPLSTVPPLLYGQPTRPILYGQQTPVQAPIMGWNGANRMLTPVQPPQPVTAPIIDNTLPRPDVKPNENPLEKHPADRPNLNHPKYQVFKKAVTKKTKSTTAKPDVKLKIETPPKLERPRWVNSFTEVDETESELINDEKIKETEEIKKHQEDVTETKKTKSETRSPEKITKPVVDDTEAYRQKARELLKIGEELLKPKKEGTEKAMQKKPSKEFTASYLDKSKELLKLGDELLHRKKVEADTKTKDRESFKSDMKIGKEGPHSKEWQSSIVLEKVRQNYSHVDKISSSSKEAHVALDSRQSSIALEKVRQRDVSKSSSSKEAHLDSRQSSIALEKVRQNYTHVDTPSKEARFESRQSSIKLEKVRQNYTQVDKPSKEALFESRQSSVGLEKVRQKYTQVDKPSKEARYESKQSSVAFEKVRQNYTQVDKPITSREARVDSRQSSVALEKVRQNYPQVDKSSTSKEAHLESRQSRIALEKVRQNYTHVDKSRISKETIVDSRQASDALEKVRQNYSLVDRPSPVKEAHVDSRPSSYSNETLVASNIDRNLPFYLATQAPNPGALIPDPPPLYPDQEFNYWDTNEVRETTLKYVPVSTEPVDDFNQYPEERGVRTLTYVETTNSPPKDSSPLKVEKDENVQSKSPSPTYTYESDESLDDCKNKNDRLQDLLPKNPDSPNVESRKRPYSPEHSEVVVPKVPKMAPEKYQVILSKEDCNEPFSGRDLEMFETLLVNIIQFTGGLPPLIEETVRTKNKLKISCANEYSQKWLLQYVPRLKLDGVNLRAVKDEPSSRSFELVFPPTSKSAVELFKMLEVFNCSLDASQWVVLSSLNRNDKRVFTVTVPEESANYFKDCEYKLFFGLQPVAVKPL